MARDILVIDIETKNTFQDVGGQHKVRDLDASLVGVYSYNENRLFGVREGNFHHLHPILKNTGLIIGFSTNRFDIPVMEKYFDFDITSIPSFDILEEIENNLGRRVSLDILAQENLKVGKTGHGLDAIKYYKEGNWEALEKYCLHDVSLTKDLYELIKKQRFLMVPHKWGLPTKVDIHPKEPVLEVRQASLF